MRGETPARLVPKLRFPDFEGSPAWECHQLKKLATRVKQRNTQGRNLRPLTNSAEHGVVDQRDYFDKDIATTTDNYFVVEQGDYVYNPRVSAAAPVGPISKNAVGTGVISPLYTVFRFRSGVSDYFAHYFKSSHWHTYLRRTSNTGARHDRMAITNSDFMRMPIPTPQPPEQQKIANCLGSLDDLIAAERRKLEVLRRHKKGLMQQLFPQPGETVPRLRFPDYEAAGHWRQRVLGKEGEFLSALTGKAAADFDTGNAHFIPYNNVFANTFIDPDALRRVRIGDGETQNLVQKGDVFFTVSSENPEDAGMSSVLLDDIANCYLNSFCALFRPDSRSVIDMRFLGHMLRSGAVRAYLATNAQGSTRFNIAKRVFRDLPICVPGLPEQEIIAETLDSLEQRLAGQTARLNELMSHKDGLLQQLFPKPTGR